MHQSTSSLRAVIPHGNIVLCPAKSTTSLLYKTLTTLTEKKTRLAYLIPGCAATHLLGLAYLTPRKPASKTAINNIIAWIKRLDKPLHLQPAP